MKNLGNTCYLNSLIQTWFLIPAIRQSILRLSLQSTCEFDGANTVASLSAKLNPSVHSPKAHLFQCMSWRVLSRRSFFFFNPNNKIVLLQLQKLFSYLILTNQSFIDPSPIIYRLKECFPSRLNFGSQEDVSEFNDLFLDILENGFKSLGNDQENIIQKYFYGRSNESLDAIENDSSPINKENNNVFSHLVSNMLPVDWYQLNNKFIVLPSLTTSQNKKDVDSIR